MPYSDRPPPPHDEGTTAYGQHGWGYRMRRAREDIGHGPDRSEYGQRNLGGAGHDDSGPVLDYLRDFSTQRRGPKGWKRSDERLYEDVCEALAGGGVDASEITVKVEDGECTLTGTVASRGDRRRAEEIVEGVHGVVDVHNRLMRR
jgi:hypothetical protein